MRYYKMYTRFMLAALLLLFNFCSYAQHHDMKMNMHKGEKKTHTKQNIYLAMMDTMMLNMDTVKMNRYADVDFLRMMIPHHQGAIDMAMYEIKHGKNFEMKQLAKSIIAEQNIEIEQMGLRVKYFGSKKATNSNSYKEPLMQTMAVMMQDLPSADLLADTDKAFAAVMLPHHQAGVDMAKVILQFGDDKIVARMAQNIISSQQVEIEQMKSFLQN